MCKFQCLLLTLKRSYICFYIIYMTVPIMLLLLIMIIIMIILLLVLLLLLLPLIKKIIIIVIIITHQIKQLYFTATVSSNFAKSFGARSLGISSKPRDFNLSMLLLNSANGSSRSYCA